MSGELPEGWKEVRLGSVLKLVNGFAFKPSHWGTKGLPIIRIQNLNNPDAPFNYCEDGIPQKVRVKNGDLLFAWSGTPGTSFGAHIWNGGDAWLNQHIFRVEFDPHEFDREFLKHPINVNLSDYIAQAHGGAGLAHITKGKFESSLLRVAPLAEQRRIVAKLQETLTNVESCKSHLARVPAIVERFRQSVLAAACSGRLTEEWRAEREVRETSRDFIDRAIQIRTGVLKSKVRSVADTIDATSSELPDVPEGWEWATIDELSTKVVDGVHRKPNYVKKGVPFLTVRNLTAGNGIAFDKANFISEEEHQEFVKRANPEKGDLLITKDGTLGVVRVVDTNKPFSIFVSLAMIKPCIRTSGPFLAFALNSPQINQRIVVTGTGLQHIHLRDLRKVPIPIPPEDEQHEIVRRVQELMDYADQINPRIVKSMNLVNELTPSLLSKAFRGDLITPAFGFKHLS